MNSDEEYLDDLLNSLMDGEEGADLLPEGEETAEGSEFDEGMMPADLGFGADEFIPDDFVTDDFVSGDMEDPDIKPFTAVDPEEASREGSDVEESVAEDDFALEDFVTEEPDLDSLGISDFHLEEGNTEDGRIGEEGLISPDDVDAMFAAADAVVSDGDAFQAEEPEENDMLSFLDNMPVEENEAEGSLSPSNRNIEEEATGDIKEETDNKKAKKEKRGKKEKKEKKPLFGRKKKNKKEEEPEEETETVVDSGSMDEILLEDEAKKEAEEKPKSFFSRMIEFLTESDEEEEESQADGLEPSDENKNILKELDDEDKKKKKKKVKGKKGEDGEEKGKPKKEKKKKEKKKKEKAEASDEAGIPHEAKKGKRVSIKSMIVIAGLCLTVTAMIIVMCSIVPEFFDKRKARDAFYESDYIKSYELLYGKKLDENDEMIYNKSKTILEIKRKLDSYHNYLGMGKEIQALDALMSGIQDYPEILIKAEEYRVVQEVNAVYETILNILNDKYYLSEGVAKAIVEYDDVTYTRKLESLVNGTPFLEPVKAEDPAISEDILPEERALMEQESPEETEESLNKDDPDLSEQNVNEEDAEELPMENADGDIAEDEAVQEQDTEEEQSPDEEPASVPEEPFSTGEDVSSWTGESGGQGEQIQGIRQPIDIQIHGN